MNPIFKSDERGATIEQLLALDDALARKGILPLTGRWKAELARFYRHRTAKTLVARVGRGGVKSQTATKVGFTETIFGNWNVPLGERHYFAFVSVNKAEATQRLRLLEAMLRALDIAYTRSGDEIALRDKPLGFKVFAAQIGAVSGFRCIGYICDELAKWMADDASKEAAIEVIASLQAMYVTHGNARKLLISSPFGILDEHYRRFKLGDTDDQLVAFAPRWVANPSITKEQTHRLEPNESIWSREYAAIPCASLSGALLTAESVQTSRVRKIPQWFLPMSAETMVDASAGHLGGDPYAHMIVRYWKENPYEVHLLKRADNERGCAIRISDIDGKPIRRNDRPPMSPILQVEFCDRLVAPFHDKWPPSRIVKQIAFNSARFGSTKVHGDQFSEHCYAEYFKAEGMRMFYHPLTAVSKTEACQTLRKMCDSGIADSPCADALCDELISYQGTMTAGVVFATARPKECMTIW